MFNEFKIPLSGITNDNVTVGCNSFVASLTPSLQIKSWCYDSKDITINYKHIPSKPFINATIQITDKDDSRCYDTVDVFIPQATTIWCTEGTYIERDVCDECCNDGVTISRGLKNIEVEVSTINGNPWITNIKAFIYRYDYFFIDCKKNGGNKFTITITLTKCYDIVNCPLIICGYNDENELIGQTTLYLTVNHIKSACEDSDSGDTCILQINPTKITVPFGLYKTFDELKKNIGVNCTAFSSLTGTTLQYGTTIENITENAFNVNSVFKKFYPISEFISETNFSNTWGKEITKTSGTTFNENFTFSLGNNCSQTLNIVLQGETIIDKDIVLVDEDGNKLDILQIFFLDLDSNEHDEHNHPPTTEDWEEQEYDKTYTCEFNNSDWYIYQCDSSIIQCVKNGNELKITLVDYAPISYEDPLTIILKNSYGNVFYIYYAVDEGLVAEDEYSMYWRGYYDYYYNVDKEYNLADFKIFNNKILIGCIEYTIENGKLIYNDDTYPIITSVIIDNIEYLVENDKLINENNVDEPLYDDDDFEGEELKEFPIVYSVTINDVDYIITQDKVINEDNEYDIVNGKVTINDIEYIIEETYFINKEIKLIFSDEENNIHEEYLAINNVTINDIEYTFSNNELINKVKIKGKYCNDICTTTYYEYYSNEYQQPLILHSACSLVFEGNKPRYEGWTINASTNNNTRVSYTLKQWLKTVTVGLNTWTVFDNFIVVNGNVCEIYNDVNDNNIKKVKVNDVVYTIDEIPSLLEEPEWVNVSVGKIYTANGEIDSEAFDSRIWINKAENPNLGDFLIQTNTTFNTEQECYIDFYQNNGNASVRLMIKHNPMLIYRIYTDQIGFVRVDTYKQLEKLDGDIEYPIVDGKLKIGDKTYTIFDDILTDGNVYVINDGKVTIGDKKYTITEGKLIDGDGNEYLIIDGKVTIGDKTYTIFDDILTDGNVYNIVLKVTINDIEYTIEDNKLINGDDVYNIVDGKVTIGNKKYTITEGKLIDGDGNEYFIINKVTIGDKEYVKRDDELIYFH